ncbi:helix-turn-helix domain-containing protein [Vacuolonema iberomarrocanum]|uniref:helix-turn-helix domain-containing protein n=1 Tax=Vacuolonema iberomarrocanum TaxID=3454632 RepID=UPI0019FADEAF|nr:TetR/AcrR family transcriptional regulator [filamentous cyanobacterium LEGE 07170]
MAQVLKEQIRFKILDASARAFVEAGYQGATVSDIARLAGVAVGNIYRYFGGKEELFKAVVTAEFAEKLLMLLRKNIKTLSHAGNDADLDDAALDAQEQLLAFWITHRRQVIIILDRCKGTEFEGFADQFVEIMVTLAVTHARDLGNRADFDPDMQFVLQTVFRNTVKVIVSILEHHEREEDIRNAFRLFRRYQLDGLNGLLGGERS